MMRIETYWNAIGTVGLEHLVLQVRPDGITADGLVLLHHDDKGLRIGYTIHCGTDWRTHELSVKLLGENEVSMKVSVDSNGNWLDSNGRVLHFLKGCIDVDLMATPFTNTLPIQRLNLGRGEAREIDVAYVRIPDLQLHRVGQRYTCLERGTQESRYIYESLVSDFKAELVVDEDGLVMSYQWIWERAGIYRIS